LNEGVLAECLRLCSSFSNHRISPLAKKYELPRPPSFKLTRDREEVPSPFRVLLSLSLLEERGKRIKMREEHSSPPWGGSENLQDN